MSTVRRTHNPWLWIPTLCTAEEIPTTVVMYVALLMLFQFGADMVMSSVYAALLFLPWVTKSYLYSKVRNAGAFKRNLHVAEALTFLCLMGVAVYVSEAKIQPWVLFLLLFILSCLCAWHELLSRLYYSRMLRLQSQHVFMGTKLLSSQVAQVVTYGVLIIVAGGFEVFFRSYQKAWAMESSLVAGGFLVFLVLNVVVLSNQKVIERYRHETLAQAVKTELHVLSRIQQKQHVLPVLVSFFLLLLPQALLFNTRVFFLLTPVADGGLGCSVQDVGFAQGTIGVLAFSVGLAGGRLLMRRLGESSLFWPMAILLTLSPLSYMLMARAPQPNQLWLLCCVTSFAQLCFGFGLNLCRVFVPYISEHRYRNTTNFLTIPMVASLMIVPMALSGWLCSRSGFATFFTVCVAMAPMAWLVLLFTRLKQILINNE